MGLMLRDREELKTKAALDLGEFVGAIRRRMLVVLLATIIGAVGAFLYASARRPVYTSTADVLVRPILNSPIKPIEPVSMQTEIRIATSAAVGDIARKTMGAEVGTRRLQKGLSVDSPEGTDILEISYSDRDPEVARIGAQAFADAYLLFKGEQAADALSGYTEPLSEQIAKIDLEIAGVNRALARLAAGSARWEERLDRRKALETQRLVLQNEIAPLISLNTDPGQVIREASLPSSPSGLGRKRVLGLGAILGLLAGIGVAYVWHEADRAGFR